MKNQKGFVVPLLIIIIVVLVIGGGVYVYNQNKKITEQQEKLSTNTPTSSTSESTPTPTSSSVYFVDYDRVGVIAKIKKDHPELTPILLPTKFISGNKNATESKIFANYTKYPAYQNGNTAYWIVFSGEEGCTAHVCESGAIYVAPMTIGGINEFNHNLSKNENVKLSNNIIGYYQPAECGADCANPEIVTLINNNLYTFSVAGEKQDLINWVNSAIENKQ